MSSSLPPLPGDFENEVPALRTRPPKEDANESFSSQAESFSTYESSSPYGTYESRSYEQQSTSQGDHYNQPSQPQQATSQGYYNQPPQEQQSYYNQGSVYVQQPPKTNVMAVVSIVTAFIVNFVGVITGIISLNQIKKTGESGRGLAITGIVVGAVSFVFSIFVVLGIVTSYNALDDLATTKTVNGQTYIKDEDGEWVPLTEEEIVEEDYSFSTDQDSISSVDEEVFVPEVEEESLSGLELSESLHLKEGDFVYNSNGNWTGADGREYYMDAESGQFVPID